MAKIWIVVICLSAAVVLWTDLCGAEDAPLAPTDKEEPRQQNDTDVEIAKLIERLGATSHKTRKKAAQRLAEIGESALPALNRIFGIGIAEETSTELEAEIAVLIKQLDSEEWENREKATIRLAEIGKVAIPALRAAAATSSMEVKHRAEKILAKIEERLKAEKENTASRFLTRLEAIRLLGAIGSADALEGLLAALQEKDKILFTEALLALRNAHNHSFGFSLSDLLSDRQKVVATWQKYSPEIHKTAKKTELKLKYNPGEESETESTFSLQIDTTAPTSNSNIIVGGAFRRAGKKVEKKEETPTTSTRSMKLDFAQKYTDLIKESTSKQLAFERTYEKHKFVKSGDETPETVTTFEDKKVMVIQRPGLCGVKSEDEELPLVERARLAECIGAMSLLLPDEFVAVGDSWALPEMAALKLIKSIFPDTELLKNIQNISLRCLFSGVQTHNGADCLRISLIGYLQTIPERQEGIRDIARGAAIVRIKIGNKLITNGFGSSDTVLGDTAILGECYLDPTSGKILSVNLFGASYWCEPEDGKDIIENRGSFSFQQTSKPATEGQK